MELQCNFMPRQGSELISVIIFIIIATGNEGHKMIEIIKISTLFILEVYCRINYCFYLFQDSAEA